MELPKAKSSFALPLKRTFLIFSAKCVDLDRVIVVLYNVQYLSNVEAEDLLHVRG